MSPILEKSETSDSASNVLTRHFELRCQALSLSHCDSVVCMSSSAKNHCFALPVLCFAELGLIEL